ncbi:MAG: hypothetical protein ACP5QB_04775 [Thiomonas sp.]
MQAVADFFAFRTFVSLDVLRVVYALGAIGMPLMAWGVWLWLGRFRFGTGCAEPPRMPRGAWFRRVGV